MSKLKVAIVDGSIFLVLRQASYCAVVRLWYSLKIAFSLKRTFLFQTLELSNSEGAPGRHLPVTGAMTAARSMETGRHPPQQWG